MATKASKAEHCGGIPPLGYDVDPDGKLIINEAEAETVREIFRLYLVGCSLSKMAKQLNDMGMRTKAGKPFTKNSFSNLLTQEKYIGVYRWDKRRAKDSRGKHNNHAYKPVEEQTVVEGGCPAIIPLEQFQAVQERLSERKQGRVDTKNRHYYMLGGLKIMKCAECGSYMVGKITKSHGKEYISYACPHHKGGDCPTRDIRAEYLEKYVSRSVLVNLIREYNIQHLNELVSQDKAKISQLKNKLISVDKKIDHVVKNLEEVESSCLRESMQQLESEHAGLIRKINDAKASAPLITVENRKEVMGKMRNVIREECSRPKGKKSSDPCKSLRLEVREMLKAYVQEILVSNEDVKVTLQL